MTDALLFSQANGVATLTLNRPQRHNAFDDILITQLHEAIKTCENDPNIRIVRLMATGDSFSAGADLQWMKKMASFTKKENQEDALAFAKMLASLAKMEKPSIAVVQGDVFGGGIGLIAACDIAIASTQAIFCFSEVKLGLVPAVISPYVINAIGAHAAKRLFMTAERFDANQAMELGLIADVIASDELNAEADKLTQRLLTHGPNSLRLCKKLVAHVKQKIDASSIIAFTADIIAECRVSAEGQEGIGAFLEKRKPSWSVDSD